MAVERFTAAEASRWALLRSTGRPAHQRASLIQLLYVDAAGFAILRAPRSSGLGELRRQRARMASVGVNRSGAPRQHPHGGRVGGVSTRLAGNLALAAGGLAVALLLGEAGVRVFART